MWMMLTAGPLNMSVACLLHQLVYAQILYMDSKMSLPGGLTDSWYVPYGRMASWVHEVRCYPDITCW